MGGKDQYPKGQRDRAQQGQLESEKLKALRAFNKPFWKKASSYVSIASVITAIIALAFSWIHLNSERAALAEQVKQRQERAASAKKEFEARLQSENQVAVLRDQLARVTRERDGLQVQNAALKREAKEVELLQAVNGRMTFELSMLQASNAVLRARNEKQSWIISNANEVLWQGFSLSLCNRTTWTKFKDFDTDVHLVRRVCLSYLPKAAAEAELNYRVEDLSRRTYEDDKSFWGPVAVERVMAWECDRIKMDVDTPKLVYEASLITKKP